MDRSPPILNALTNTELIIGPQNGYLIQFETDDLTSATLFYRRAGEANFTSFKTSRYFQDEHHFTLSQEDASGSIEYYIQLRNSAGIESTSNNDGRFFHLNLSEEFPPGNILVEKNRFAFNGFLMPYASDLNENLIPDVIFSELIDGKLFGTLQAGEFENENFVIQQLSDYPAIPRDKGNIPENGVPHLFSGFGADAALMAAPSPGEFPQTVVWQDTVNFWASRMQNYDSDPEPELFGLKFARWRILILTGIIRLLKNRHFLTRPKAIINLAFPGLCWKILMQTGRRKTSSKIAMVHSIFTKKTLLVNMNLSGLRGYREKAETGFFRRRISPAMAKKN